MATISGAEAPEYILSAIRTFTTPDILGSFVGVDADCPFDSDSASEIVDGVFIRSRVSNERDDGELFLLVSISCLVHGASYIFSTDIVMDVRGIGDPWRLAWDWGTYGFGGRDYIRSVLRDGVENAITDFIRAHMGP